ncbi:MAG: WG repeat-containing protein [Cyclobacteriaceae bacterium]
MQRLLLVLSILFAASCTIAGGLKIVTDNGKQGIADEEGKVLVPPIYDKLGWSNRTSEVVGGAIGYYENGKWGIINIENGKLSSARYATLEPFNESLYEAGITGRFTNIIFKGLIDAKLKVHLDFHYYTIDPLDESLWLVSEYNARRLDYGVFSIDNELIIPTQFRQIEKQGKLLNVQNQQKKFKLYASTGAPVSDVWYDKISFDPEGYTITNNGYVGRINADGQIVHSIEYKDIVDGEVRSFPEWEIREVGKDEGTKIKCDSVVFNKATDLLIAHVNNTEHILAVSDKVFKDKQVQLKYLGQGFVVTQHNISNEWGIYKTDGRLIASQFDTIAIDSSYFYAHHKEGWDVYNLFGRKINERPYEAVGFSHAGNIPVAKRNFWGWIDFQGTRMTTLKYDSLAPGLTPDHYIANSYGKWGVRTFADEWMIMPKYESVLKSGELYIGKKDQAFHVYDLSGKLLHQVPYKIIQEELLKLTDGDLFGLLTEKGKYIYPGYERVYAVDAYYALQARNVVMLIDEIGNTIISLDQRVEEVLSFSEGYFHVIKDGQHGFVDTEGKLRIANRYDSALLFSEGLAAIKLRGNWGFVDDTETLVIQPYYTYSSTFSDGLAIIQTDGKYGIIDPQGNEIINPVWQLIERLPTGNYRLTDDSGRLAMVSRVGKIIFRAKFDYLEDSDLGLVVVEKFGKKGVMDYTGLTKVPFEYEEIKISGDYLLLRKE